MDAVLVGGTLALCGTIAGTVVGPWVIGRQTNKQLMDIKEQDWKRQDAVAAKAKEAADLLVKANAKIALVLDESNSKTDASLMQIHQQATEIHGLVNSTLTESMQSQLTALEQQYSFMKELRKSPESISELEKRIVELRTKLTDRATATRLAAKAVK